MFKKINFLMLFFILGLQSFSSEFKYCDFEYSKYDRTSMEYTIHSGEMFIEESPKITLLKIVYMENDIPNYIKLSEKEWKKFLEISDIYISFSNMADREEIKIDKYIDAIESVTAGQTEGTKEEKSKATIKFYVISQDFNLHNLVFSIVYSNGKSRRLYFSKEQVIELQNRINKDNIIGAIYDNNTADEEINP